MKYDIHGVLLLDKLPNLSSNAMLQKVKRLYGAKKAGHTGSLDPIATGLLPICFGQATKFAQFLLHANKRYFVEVKLGIKTDTGDLTGNCVAESTETKIKPRLLEQVLNKFKGESEQIPPMYSALKHQGTPLYKLARKGCEVQRSPRKITIFELNLKAFGQETFALEVSCSKGTYIRTLVEDIAETLGTFGHVIGLRRLSVGCFGAEDMVCFEEIARLAEKQDRLALESKLLPLESLVLKLNTESKLTS